MESELVGQVGQALPQPVGRGPQNTRAGHEALVSHPSPRRDPSHWARRGRSGPGRAGGMAKPSPHFLWPHWGRGEGHAGRDLSSPLNEGVTVLVSCRQIAALSSPDSGEGAQTSWWSRVYHLQGVQRLSSAQACGSFEIDRCFIKPLDLSALRLGHTWRSATDLPSSLSSYLEERSHIKWFEFMPPLTMIQSG